MFFRKKALETIGDEEIDKIFNIVSNNISDKLWNRYCLFIDRCQLESENGLTSEILDFNKRDISWACIEYLLNINGLFSNLLGIYEEGYFPCSWIGKYPSGKPVVV